MTGRVHWAWHSVHSLRHKVLRLKKMCSLLFLSMWNVFLYESYFQTGYSKVALCVSPDLMSVACSQWECYSCSWEGYSKPCPNSRFPRTYSMHGTVEWCREEITPLFPENNSLFSLTLWVIILIRLYLNSQKQTRTKHNYVIPWIIMQKYTMPRIMQVKRGSILCPKALQYMIASQNKLIDQWAP